MNLVPSQTKSRQVLANAVRVVGTHAGVADHGIAILDNQSDSYGLIEEFLAETLAP